MAPLAGRCEERFEPLREVIAARLGSGDELGLAVAVEIDGELVVDLHGGWMDSERARPWGEDTIVNVWSTTKAVTALAALMLVDRGLLDLDAPVARYWPEFAANGKDGILVRHVLSHTSGVSSWEQPFALEELYDWERSSEVLAGQAPWWEPGAASGYHAAAYGQLVGELVRRVSGKPLKAFVAEEIAGPLGADFQIGAAEADWDRISPVVPPPPLPIDVDAVPQDSPMFKTLFVLPFEAATANTEGWRRADLGGLNGHGNAMSVLRIGSAITRLLSPATLERIFEEQARGVDLVLAIPLRWGIGYGLPEPATLPYIPEGRVFFWGGWGGSMIIMDLERRMTIAYVMNQMGFGIIGSENAAAYCDAIYECLSRAAPAPLAR